MRLQALEQDILNSIIQVLLLKGVLAIHVRNTGVMINRDGKTVFGRSNPNQLGAPDLIFAYRGIPVACEVKSKTGKLRPEQIEWFEKWSKKPNSGFGFVARSVDDVLGQLANLDAKVAGEGGIRTPA